jgi:hypothetical protein
LRGVSGASKTSGVTKAVTIFGEGSRETTWYKCLTGYNNLYYFNEIDTMRM